MGSMGSTGSSFRPNEGKGRSRATPLTANTCLQLVLHLLHAALLLPPPDAALRAGDGVVVPLPLAALLLQHLALGGQLRLHGLLRRLLRADRLVVLRQRGRLLPRALLLELQALLLLLHGHEGAGSGEGAGEDGRERARPQ